MANISTSLTQVVSSVKTAATAFTSGVSALPGGMNAIASVVNNAKGALNSIPSAGAVAGALGSVSGALGSLTGAAAKGLGALKAGSASLTALASTGLSPAAAAQLNSAIAALSSGSAVPIKLPTVATGTFDRGELTAQLASVFGSTKIPAFAAAGNPATFGKSLSSEQIKKYDETKVAISTATDEFFAQNITTRNAQAAYEKAKTELPQGDPQIEQMKAVFLAETSKAAAIEKKIAALRAQ